MRPEPPSVLAAALASGVLLGVATLPGPFGPLAFVGFLPLLRAVARGLPPRRAAAAGFSAGLVYFGIGFGWVPLASGGLPAYLLALPLLAAVFGVFALLVAALARRSAPLALAAAPGLWVALEYGRSQEWLLSVPWAHLGYGLADWPLLAEGASVAGLYGLSFWIVAANAGWLLLPRLPLPARGLGALLLLAPLAPGLASEVGGAIRPPGAAPSFRVAAVQPAIPEPDRHDPARFHAHLRQLLELSDRALAEPAALVVWPESAYERPAGATGDAFLGAISHHLGVPLLSGVWRLPDPDGGSWRNGALLAAEGRTSWVAEKVHPVPVYERIAEGTLSRALAAAGLGSGRFGRGEPSQPLLLQPASGGEALPIGVLVCIDASYPELARRLRVEGARLLVVVANEAGTGPWSAALHARAARLRAIEGRVPVVRVANTGPTLWIDARGRSVAELPAGAAAAGAVALAPADAPGPFVFLGDAWVAAAAAATALVAAVLALAGRQAAAPRLVLELPATQRGISS
jgi:apolipoprotein N-acyltransferase